ncbi:MAG: UDP-N-acetylglucosamine--N-acetylmuramyl-(pentapeptide) pyrophosphoryl-undecaprenol N-acetylglucosamine transferase [Candidatus Omnitrophota bacterium]
MTLPVHKIMVVASGSCGHVFPAIGFCNELKETRLSSFRIVFVTTPEFDMVGPEFNPVFLKVNKSARGIFRLVIATLKLMFDVRPDIVFGFGGYFCVPFLILAKILGKKTLFHEQNVVPGRANRFLAAWVDRIAISFPGTEKYFKDHRKKICLTRYPLRKNMRVVPKEEALRFFGFETGFFTVLVVGGSQGASRLNNVFIEAIKVSNNSHRLQVIHLAGRVNAAVVKETYCHLNVKSKVFDFLSDMEYAYSAADLAVSRSGAGCVIEIMRFGLPSILVPYPFAGAHQVENARVLADKGGAIMVEDHRLTPELIGGLLDIFIDDRIRRKAMSSIVSSLYLTAQNPTLSELVTL